MSVTEINSIPDDLDAIQVTPFNKTNPTAVSTAQPSPAKPTSQSVAWGDKSIATVGDGLDRVKAEIGKKVRFALIPGVDPQADKTHFLMTGPKKGLFKCLGNGCPLCEREDARWSIAALVVAYTNADCDTGKMATDMTPQYKIGHLSLSQSNFKVISELTEEGKTPYDVDIAMAFDGRRYTFNVVGSVPRYVAGGDTEKILEMAKPFIPLLKNKVGRKATADLFRNAPERADVSDMERYT